MSFDSLGLKSELLRAVADKGYTVPTPIQTEAIPAVLSGRDVLAGAQTGTGKTAGFTLPLLQKLGERGARNPRALVLTPTRELAAQVEQSIQDYGKYVSLRSLVIFGGVSEKPQIDKLRHGCDILVATPGRLLDLAEQRAVSLADVQVFVLDEADRMLDMGFLPAIKRIVAKVPAKRQTLLFSATFEPRIRGLAMEFLRSPAEVEVAARNTVASTIEHIAHPVDNSRKRELLTHLLATRFQERVLVFGKTKHGCNRLAEQLEESGIKASAIHGNKSQGQRQKALNEFKTGKCRVLVATDVAARGLDIPELPLVINYDLPMVAEDYVHRIGRTGRNGATGEAISLVAIDEGGLLSQVQKLLGKNVRQVIVEGFEPSQALRMDAKPAVSKRSGRPAARPHGKPAARTGHAQAPKQRQGARPAQRRSSSR